MNIEHLYEFIELSRQLNFTAAAKTLHMTQPALSNHVHALEKEAGVLLIERSPKDYARLTPAGQCFLDMAKQITALHADTLPKLQELQHSITGKITVRSPRHEYSSPLLSYVFEFQKEYPQIDVIICPWEDTDGIKDVTSGAVDFAYLGYGGYEDEDFLEKHGVELVPYTQAEIFLWIDQSHPLASADKLDIQDLDGSTILIPANKKRDSWVACVESVIGRFGLSCGIDERYCDSLEDLALNKVAAGDVLLCDANLLGFPPFQLREDRLTKRFTPEVHGPVSLCYRNEGGDHSVQLFVDFLYRKYQAACKGD